jgi:hypothetical protein
MMHARAAQDGSPAERGIGAAHPGVRGGPAIDSGFDPEHLLLLHVARTEMDVRRRTEMRSLANRVHWSRLLAAAARHRLLPFLALHLRELEDRMPEDVAGSLDAYRIDNARRVLRAITELRGVLNRFQDDGIDAVPYKGPVLGAQLYGSAALRRVGDLDILLRREQVLPARALLLGMGYRPRHELGAGGEAFMLRSRYSETFDHPTSSAVELHWAFTNRDIALALGFDDLQGGLVPVRIGGLTFQGFGREDLLLILAVHGSKHRWDRLEWLCGLAEAVRSVPGGFAWDSLLARADALGVRRMLLLGLLLAHDLLDARVPPLVLRRARADATVVRLAAQVPGYMVQEPGNAEGDSLATDIFRYHLRERMRDRLRFIVYRVTTPSRPESWSSVQIGTHNFAVHSLVRPFQLIGKAGPALRMYLQRRGNSDQ